MCGQLRWISDTGQRKGCRCPISRLPAVAVPEKTVCPFPVSYGYHHRLPSLGTTAGDGTGTFFTLSNLIITGNRIDFQ